MKGNKGGETWPSPALMNMIFDLWLKMSAYSMYTYDDSGLTMHIQYQGLESSNEVCISNVRKTVTEVKRYY